MNIRNYPDGWDREPEFRAFNRTDAAHADAHRLQTIDAYSIHQLAGNEALIAKFLKQANPHPGPTTVKGERELTTYHESDDRSLLLAGHFVNYVDVQTGYTAGPFPLFL